MTRPGWVQLVVVAVAYLVVGRLSLLLAIPPGYATAVWPAAGLALVAAARWRTAGVAGVALGSFGVNVATGGAAIAASLAIGAAVQAFVGACAIRRLLGDAPALTRGREIAMYFVVGGPLACVIAASWGMLVLWGFGAIPAGDVPYSWLTWWVGDTVGVTLAAPMALVLVGEPRAIWRTRRLSVLVPLIVGTIGVMLVYVDGSRHETARFAAQIDQRALAITHAIEQRAERYADAVHATASFLAANPELAAAQFATFAQGTFGRDRDIQVLAWAPLVTPATRAQFPGEIRERGPGGLVRARDRAEMFPVLFVEAKDRVHGFDLGSDPTRAEAIAHARASRAPAATRPLRLLSGDPGFVIIAPVFAADGRTLRGIAVGGFSTPALVLSATQGLPTADLDIAITDVTWGLPLDVIGTPRAGAVGHPVRIGGRTWRISIAAKEPPPRGWQAWFALLRWLLVSLLGAVLLAITGARARLAEAEARKLEELEASVAERTRDLAGALAEKEALLKEIHHRVKNNLQVISSLLRLQAHQLAEPALRDAFDASQQRIQTIALVHERLYRSTDLAEIGFGDYLTNLVEHVLEAHDAADRGITATVAADGIAVSIQIAIPCGLVVNELVTNALKHAFPAGRRGTIAIALARDGGDLVVTVADDGVGLPATVDPATARSLGLDLVATFADQLGARMTVSRERGTTFTLRFPA